MKTTIKYIAPWIAAAAAGGAIGLAPVAVADPGFPPVSLNRVVAHAAPSPMPAPTPVENGASPLVPLGVNPDSQEPYDPYLKNPAGGVDLPS